MVYPRVGGGTTRRAGPTSATRGLSPRGRGNRPAGTKRPAPARSIPAWAGEPGHRAGGHGHAKVYPRVGGGTPRERVKGHPATGLSPRGRGNRQRPGQCPAGNGSIPAWAGEPPSPPRWPPTSRVYPRVGGGTESGPRARPMDEGLSPRGRGNRPRGRRGRQASWSIPAWAGEPLRNGRSPTGNGVYPRVGGGTTGMVPMINGCEGLSPRGRGNQLARKRQGGWARSIPAWAGEPV